MPAIKGDISPEQLFSFWWVFEEIEQELSELVANAQPMKRERVLVFSMIYCGFNGSFYHVLRPNHSTFASVRGHDFAQRQEGWARWQPVFRALAEQVIAQREELAAALEHAESLLLERRLPMAYWDDRPMRAVVDELRHLQDANVEDWTAAFERSWTSGEPNILAERLLSVLPQPVSADEVAGQVFRNVSSHKHPEQRWGSPERPFEWDIEHIPQPLRTSVERCVFLAELFKDEPSRLADVVGVRLAKLDRGFSALAIPLSDAGMPDGIVFCLTAGPPHILPDNDKLAPPVARAARRVFEARMHMLRDAVYRDPEWRHDPGRSLYRNIYHVLACASVALEDLTRGVTLEQMALLPVRDSQVPTPALALQEWNSRNKPSFKRLTVVELPLRPVDDTDRSITVWLPFYVNREWNAKLQERLRDILRGIVSAKLTMRAVNAESWRRIALFVSHEVKNGCAALDELVVGNHLEAHTAMLERLIQVTQGAVSATSDSWTSDKVIALLSAQANMMRLLETNRRPSFAATVTSSLPAGAKLDARVMWILLEALRNASKHKATLLRVYGRRTARATAKIDIRPSPHGVLATCVSRPHRLSPEAAGEKLWQSQGDGRLGFELMRQWANELRGKLAFETAPLGPEICSVTVRYEGAAELPRTKGV